MHLQRGSLITSFLILFFFTVTVYCPLFFLSCTSDDDDDNDSSSEFDPFFPMYTGNIWYFVVQDQEGSGTGQAEVLPRESFNGYSAITVEFSDTSGQGLGNEKMYLMADNNYAEILGWTAEGLILVLDTPLRILNLPLATGNSWESGTSFTYDGIPVTVSTSTYVEGREDITVQGQTYSGTYRLFTDVTITFTIVIPITVEGTITSWLAEDIGPVKTIADLPDIPIEDIPGGHYSVEVTGTNFY